MCATLFTYNITPYGLGGEREKIEVFKLASSGRISAGMTANASSQLKRKSVTLQDSDAICNGLMWM